MRPHRGGEKLKRSETFAIQQSAHQRGIWVDEFEVRLFLQAKDLLADKDTSDDVRNAAHVHVEFFSKWLRTGVKEISWAWLALPNDLPPFELDIDGFSEP